MVVMGIFLCVCVCVCVRVYAGKVAEPEVQDKATQALRDFNTKVMSDPRVSLSIIPVGDGLALCRKRG